MTDAWKQAKEITQRNSGGVFIRLQNDGESFIGAIRGGPLASEKHWLKSSEEYAECTGKGCEHCARGIKKTTRVMFNVYVFAQTAMKIHECSGKTFEDLCNLRDSLDLGKWAVEIKRHGAAKSTKTKYTVFPKRETTAQERAQADAAPLHDLATADAAREDDDEVPPPPPAAPPPDLNARIAAPVVAEFRERLRPLPKEAAYYPILGTFGCERLADILAVDEHKARTLIERAERGENLAPPAKNELDDFA
jgi:hypothetical protein